MIGIVDYNAGNITSVEHALSFLQCPYIISKKPQDLQHATALIFPGVGEASYAMKQLKTTGFDLFLKDFCAQGKPLLGICLGSQIIFDYSEEGDTVCLGLLRGNIRHFSSILNEKGINDSSLKIPHMGWNSTAWNHKTATSNPLLDGVPSGSDFYFVHSYVIQPEDSSIIDGSCDYGFEVPSILHKDSIYAMQFHPEKSGKQGLALLKNFIKEYSC
ncbi:MAG TPA: imidazole glycerol phosphate synthase subunit HisH [Treponemataceae bacterium]|nr:imidazole glycerol phosphate synthase subunit HisH [Treponemataceae bacterium]